MATSEAGALTAHLHALVDDAGLFPPEELPMAAALARHRSDQAAASPVLSQRFICPVTSGQDLMDQVLPSDRLEVILVGALHDEARAVLGALGEREQFRVVGFETRMPAPADRDAFGEHLRSTRMPADVYVEVALGPSLGADLDQIVAWGVGAKVRCGGVTAAAFPSPAALAAFIRTAVERDVAFKATAGLHHALAHHDPVTGFDHFGFLNLLAATTVAGNGGDESAVAAMLVEREPAVVQRALGEATDALPREAFRSFGSCSTSEPVEDLAALGLIPSTPTAPSTIDGSHR